MNMDAIKAEIKEALGLVEDAKALADFWAKYFGKGGEIQKLMAGIKKVPNEEKKAYGKAVNEVKVLAQELYDAKKEEIEKKAMLARYEAESLDVTLPAESNGVGNLHPLTCIRNEIIDVFAGMGFDVFDGPEIEDDDHNFTRLNVLKDHPSRDMQDTFWLTEELLLRTHTSPGQIRVMDNQAPPIKVLMPGKVFRSDSDATPPSSQEALPLKPSRKESCGYPLCPMHEKNLPPWGKVPSKARRMRGQNATVFRKIYGELLL